MGCPIRRSTDQRVLTPPRGFSQRATSFIACACQGIHQMPLNHLRTTMNQRTTIKHNHHPPPHGGIPSIHVRSRYMTNRGKTPAPHTVTNAKTHSLCQRTSSDQSAVTSDQIRSHHRFTVKACFPIPDYKDGPKDVGVNAPQRVSLHQTIALHALRGAELCLKTPNPKMFSGRFVASRDRQSWWSQTGSNRRPPACKAGALPTELWPLSVTSWQ